MVTLEKPKTFPHIFKAYNLTFDPLSSSAIKVFLTKSFLLLPTGGTPGPILTTLGLCVSEPLSYPYIDYFTF